MKMQRTSKERGEQRGIFLLLVLLLAIGFWLLNLKKNELKAKPISKEDEQNAQTNNNLPALPGVNNRN